jgi:hypothetical protein
MRNHHEARSVHIRPFRKELPTFLLASPPPRSPSSPLVEEEEGEGEDEGRQACTAVLALNPMLTVSIASKRGWCCPPQFVVPYLTTYQLEFPSRRREAGVAHLSLSFLI